MPNTGKPSQDCHLCRSRRVKCDLGRPACQRCIKYGAECPGYRDQQELVFRNANPVTAKKRQKRAKQAFETLSPSSASITPPASRQGTPDYTQDIIEEVMYASEWKGMLNPDRFGDVSNIFPLTKSLTQHWTVQSIPIVLNVYENLHFLQNAYRANNNPREGPLVWAAHLFSRTYITNLRYPTAKYKESQVETDRELGTYLGKTLSSVKAELKTPEGPFRNDVLATVWILANYELLVGSLERMVSYSPWHLHAQGLYSILKTRGTASLLSEAGRVAFWPAYNMVQINALVCTIECPPESEEWLGFIKDNMYPGEGLSLYVAMFINKVAHIQCRVLSLIRGRNFVMASSEYETLVNEMADAHGELDAWILANKVIDHQMNPYMHDLRQSTLVKGYHLMLLLANFLTHYPACHVSLEDLHIYRKFCVETVRTAAQAILDRTPKAMSTLVKDKERTPKGLFDALKLIWPLTSVYVITSTLPEQKTQAELALAFIGKEIGVRQALSTYPGNVPIPHEARYPLGEDDGTELQWVGRLGGAYTGTLSEK